MRCVASGIFCLLPLVRCGSDLFPLVPNIFATSVLFRLLLVEVGSTGSRFGAMDIWFRLHVFREDEEENRRRKGSRLEVGFADRSTFLLYGNAYSLSTDTF